MSNFLDKNSVDYQFKCNVRFFGIILFILSVLILFSRSVIADENFNSINKHVVNSIPYSSIDFSEIMKATEILMKSIGYGVHHDGRDHIHFDLNVRDGQSHEICAHPDEDVIHVWAKGPRSIIEMTAISVDPYGSNLISRLSGKTGRHYTARRFIEAVWNAE